MKGVDRMKTIIEFFRRIQWDQVKPAVIVRYIVGIIAVINSGLVASGKSPINLGDDGANTIYLIVSMIISLIVIIINTYQNNSTSKEAIYADLILDTIESFEKESDRANIMERITAVLEDVKESSKPKEEPDVTVPEIPDTTVTVSDENVSSDNASVSEG